MELSKTEIQLLEQIANGNTTIKKIAKIIKKSDKQIYLTTTNLEKKGFVELINKNLKTKEALHITLLIQLLANTPNLDSVLSNSGIPILTSLLETSTIKEISNKTGYKKTIIYKKIQEANKKNIIKKESSKYTINKKIWFELIDFLKELNKYEAITDKRIPASAIIYYKKNKEIVFSSKEKTDAEKTAFSVYEKYGIKLLMNRFYYYLPKKKLTKKDILKHSLYIVEKDWSVQNIIFLGLFYAKYKKELKIRNKIISNLNLIFKGKIIKGYPTLKEIKDRAEIYNIKI